MVKFVKKFNSFTCMIYDKPLLKSGHLLLFVSWFSRYIIYTYLTCRDYKTIGRNVNNKRLT